MNNNAPLQDCRSHLNSPMVNQSVQKVPRHCIASIAGMFMLSLLQSKCKGMLQILCVLRGVKGWWEIKNA